ncbi:MAG: alpha/beta fold hydrolase [Rhodospirillaceae bacterium]|nr:alpha/beta fold hydrolase [Rhodospirillaceae bacterium]
MPSSAGSPLSKPIRRLVAEAAHRNPDAADAPEAFRPWTADIAPRPFVDALTRAAKDHLDAFAHGVLAYQRHPHRRERALPPPAWQAGAAALRSYGGPTDAPPAVFVPSLVNRAYILDLSADRSLMAAAAKSTRAYLLDWGAPGAAELGYSVTDYVTRVLIPALDWVKANTGAAPRLIGYCMGGTLAVAPALLRPELVSGLALLAAPWDFHVDTAASRALMQMYRPWLETLIGLARCAPVDLLQALFASLDPTLAGRKFRGFAAMDPASDPARRFVELEDWLNDGIPLAAPVARETLFDWYGANTPMAGAWRVAGTIMTPARIGCPTLAMIPAQDRIVPPGSARALAQAIPGAAARDIPLGHIGMIAGGGAARAVYAPLIDWLKAPA